jgi:HK97 family phage major capsid protein
MPVKNNIFALRQKGVELSAKATKLLDRALSQNRDLDASELIEFNANRVLLAKNGVAITEEEVLLDSERNERGGFEVREDGIGGPAVSRAGIGASKTGKGARYRELFGLRALSRDGFGDLNQFLSVVHSGLSDNRLQRGGIMAAAGAQRESDPSQGGFMVPSEFAQQILDNSLEDEIVRPRATVWPMISNSRKIPGIDGYVHTGGTLLGGVTQAFINEGDTLPLQQIKLLLIEMVAKKFGLLINASNELLSDADFDAVVGAKLREACAWELDNAFLYGTGAGVPRGISNDPALIVVAKDPSQPTATISYSNVTGMFARMYPAGRKRAVWVATSDALPQLMSLALKFLNMAQTDFVGGSSVPIFTKGADGGWELFGRPLILSEKMKALGTQFDLAFLDISQYQIGMRRELSLERSWQAGFQNDSTWFRMIARLDGQGGWKSAMAPEFGATLSPFVTLAARP